MARGKERKAVIPEVKSKAETTGAVVSTPQRGSKTAGAQIAATRRSRRSVNGDREPHPEQRAPDLPASQKRKRRSKLDVSVQDEVVEKGIESELAINAKPKAAKKKAATKQKSNVETHQPDLKRPEADDPDTEEKPKKKRRKTKEEKEAEAMPLAARASGLKMLIGAHVSAAKGVQNSVTNSVHIGGNAFALFLKSQRKWESPALKSEDADQFVSSCREHKYDAKSHVLPHGSYLVNLAQKDAEKAKQAYDCFLEDLLRCEKLGIRLYNFHPGSTGPHPRPEAIKRIASALNKSHRATSNVKTVLENMAGGGNVIGSTFEDLRDIISQVDDKSRVGVCLDTCHAFAAGYDLRTREAFKSTFAQFDKIVGLQYLSALHLNDSKAPFASHRDLHQNIGLGFLGLSAFHNVMNESRLHGLPMILETPIDRDGVEDKRIWATEIKLLESLIGTDIGSATFRDQEKQLASQGEQERAKYQEAHDRKTEKEKRSLEKGKVKGKRGGKKAAAVDDSEPETGSE
ncbi:MAG: hypothetical protein M1825_001692 [Sarcosagium campestre]|nr:MAG: hypothetical protein M1825_001692 [Sarcosagium campestre]